MQAYKQTLVVNPNFHAAHYEMALLLSGQQQMAAAVRHLRDRTNSTPP